MELTRWVSFTSFIVMFKVFMVEFGARILTEDVRCNRKSHQTLYWWWRRTRCHQVIGLCGSVEELPRRALSTNLTIGVKAALAGSVLENLPSQISDGALAIPEIIEGRRFSRFFYYILERGRGYVLCQNFPLTTKIVLALEKIVLSGPYIHWRLIAGHLLSRRAPLRQSRSFTPSTPRMRPGIPSRKTDSEKKHSNSQKLCSLNFSANFLGWTYTNTTSK